MAVIEVSPWFVYCTNADVCVLKLQVAMQRCKVKSCETR